MSSRIEQLIDEIDEFIEGCKFQPLSATKIVVNKEEMEEYLRELRLKTPDEIKRYQKIIINRTSRYLILLSLNAARLTAKSPSSTQIL